MRLFGIMLILGSFFSLNVYSYDSGKCASLRKQYLVTTRYLVSSTSFTTSTGECAAIGYHSKENKEMYYVQNELELQLDIAKGEGPYLAELSSIYGCSNSEVVNQSLMKNYKAIYDTKKPSDFIDSVMKTHNCKYL